MGKNIKFVQVGKGRFIDRDRIVIIEDDLKLKGVSFIVKYPFTYRLLEEFCSYEDLGKNSAQEVAYDLNALRND